MFKVGERIREKKGKVVWVVIENNNTNLHSRLECNLGNGSVGSLWVSYTKLHNDWELAATNLSFFGDDDLDWFTGLPTGIKQEKPPVEKKVCYHNWSRYVGLNETYEFCTQCDEKRKWEP